MEKGILRNIKLVYYKNEATGVIEYQGVRVVMSDKVTQEVNEEDREFTGLELSKILEKAGIPIVIQEVDYEQVAKENW